MRERQKKIRERLYAEAAATLLGDDWLIEECESPDFLITTPKDSFGLELTQVHIDEIVQNTGSTARSLESYNSKWLRKIVRGVEANLEVRLDVKFLGAVSSTTLRLAFLVGSEFAIK